MDHIKIKYDIKADAAYIQLKQGRVAKTKEEVPYLVDYDRKGNPLGIEIVDHSRKDYSHLPIYSRRELVALLRDADLNSIDPETRRKRK